MPRPIDSIELFFAHAQAIEREAAQRYAEFAAWFADRGEETLAGLCANLAQLERRHLQMILDASAGITLPPVEERRYRWVEAESPEAPAREVFYRIAGPRQLLEVALAAERNARRFFAWVARTTRDPEVRILAREMAREEAAHMRWVQQALEYRDPLLDWEQLLAGGFGPGQFSAS